MRTCTRAWRWLHANRNRDAPGRSLRMAVLLLYGAQNNMRLNAMPPTACERDDEALASVASVLRRRLPSSSSVCAAMDGETGISRGQAAGITLSNARINCLVWARARARERNTNVTLVDMTHQ